MNPRRDTEFEQGRPDEYLDVERNAPDDSGKEKPGGMKRVLSVSQWLLVPLILAIGLIGFTTLVGLQEEPEQLVQQEYAPLVNAFISTIEDRTISVGGNGVVNAQTRIDLVPQVGGRITRIHPSLRAGGRFSANEVLLEIEAIDYELSVVQAESEVAGAARKLELERAEAESALEEWSVLHPEEEAPQLVARRPQILEAEASLKAAEARLRLAELNLARTRLSMPFDGRVININVDAGEVVPPNVSVGMVYSNEVYEIPVPLEFDQLSWIRPASDNEEGSAATVSVRIAGTLYELVGEVVRIESELDSVSRLARAIVRLTYDQIPREVRDRFIPGMFVDVQIEGEDLESVTALPRSAMRENNSIWTVEDGRLNILQPDVIYESASDVLVRGLPFGTVVVSSQLEIITQGMRIRVRENR